MENTDEFRRKYSKMPAEEFNTLPIEELREISEVKFDTGYRQGAYHYIAVRAQNVLRRRRFEHLTKPGEVKIITPEKASPEKESKAEETVSKTCLRPKISREKMIHALSKVYSEKYMNRIVSHQHEAPQKQDISRSISYLRKIFPSTYDFREAKKIIDLESTDRLEACYIADFLRNLWEAKKMEDREKWKQSVLDEYGSWQEYFKACGWIEHKGSFYKPELVKKTADPNTLQPFHVVSYRMEKRKGYRGKKSEVQENAILEHKVKE